MAAENKPVSELYNISSARLHTHYNTTGNRLLWLINSEAFMMGIYAGLTIFRSPTPKLHAKAQMLIMVIPSLGVIITFFTLIDIITSTIAMHKIATNYKEHNQHYDQQIGFPSLDGSLFQRFLERLTPIATSLMFLLLWTFLILHDYKLL